MLLRSPLLAPADERPVVARRPVVTGGASLGDLAGASTRWAADEDEHQLLVPTIEPCCGATPDAIFVTYRLTQLQPDCRHVVRVRAANGLGWSNVSTTLLVRTTSAAASEVSMQGRDEDAAREPRGGLKAPRHTPGIDPMTSSFFNLLFLSGIIVAFGLVVLAGEYSGLRFARRAFGELRERLVRRRRNGAG